MHIWNNENPKAAQEMSFQRIFSINIWVAVIGDRLLGPHIFQGSLTGVMYLDFLLHNLPQMLDVTDPGHHQDIIYQQDGYTFSPLHFTNDVQDS